MLGAIAGPLISGLFGGGKKEVSSHVDYQRMVRDAEAAGFNPLTALRNGGAAGYSVTSTPTLSVGERVGEGVSNFFANYDPFEDKLREVQYRTMEAQLSNLQADTRVKSRMFDVPAVSGSRRELRPSGTAGQLGSLPPETQTPQRTNPYPSWVPGGLEVNPWMPDLQAWEDHLGDNEITSMVGTGLQFAQDVLWNGYRGLRAAYNAYPKGAPLSRKSSGSSKAKLPPNPLAWPAY